jgi:drug/metabolite transporter (DMT)-like permease
LHSLGLFLGLLTAALWTFTSVCFEQASRRLGSLILNTVRLGFAMALFIVFMLVSTGGPFPRGIGFSSLVFLCVSGLVGFVLGDLMLFESYVLIGARLASVVYAMASPFAAILGYFVLGERMSGFAILGVALTVLGICLAVLGKAPSMPEQKQSDGKKRLLGLLFALGGAAGQAGGLILAKLGAVDLNGFEATEARALAGFIGFLLIVLFSGQSARLLRPFIDSMPRAAAPLEKRRRSRQGLLFALAGAALGPFLGVSLGLASTQMVGAGIASALMALTPVLIIPVSVIAYGEKVRFMEILGAILAVLGVICFAF